MKRVTISEKDVPHQAVHQRAFWGVAMTFFILLVSFVLLYESKILLLVQKNMNAVILPQIQTDQTELSAIAGKLDSVDAAIAARHTQLDRWLARHQ